MLNTEQSPFPFWGREMECQLLREKNWRGHAQLIVVYGRRRVGKTSLVEYAYQDQPLWKFEGLEGEPVIRQIQGFISDLALYTNNPDLKNQKVATWRDALGILSREISGKKLIIFLDEFQWLASMKSKLVSTFKFFWDNHFRKNKDLRFVLCGSVSSFMVKKVIRSKALYGRVDTEINLQPLGIKETDAFFAGQRSKDEIIQINMIFGGIPQYLEELNPKFSLIQNLNEYAFRQHGFFFQEYRRLFISHFAENPIYEKMLFSLSEGPKSSEDLAKACTTTTGGSFTERLLDLELAGFIQRYIPIDKGYKSKIVRYRIFDEYLHFYYRFILPYVQEIMSGQISMMQITNTNKYKQWQGLAFERLCLKNSTLLAKFLNFAGIKYKCGAWFQRGTKASPGAQIDLLFDRADRVLTVCELKYVSELPARKLIENYEKRIARLLKVHHSYGIQKVLLLGRKIAVPRTIQGYFDEVLFAEDVFW